MNRKIVQALEAKGATQIEIKESLSEDGMRISYYDSKYGVSFLISGLELMQNSERGIIKLASDRFDEVRKIK